jgi:hypothetical protein
VFLKELNNEKSRTTPTSQSFLVHQWHFNKDSKNSWSFWSHHHSLKSQNSMVEHCTKGFKPNLGLLCISFSHEGDQRSGGENLDTHQCHLIYFS